MEADGTFTAGGRSGSTDECTEIQKRLIPLHIRIFFTGEFAQVESDAPQGSARISSEYPAADPASVCVNQHTRATEGETLYRRGYV